MRRPLLALALAGLACRLFFLVLEPATALAGDEHTWTTWGTIVLPAADVAFSPLRFQLIFYPPVYPYFLGAAYALLGSLTAVKVCQVVVSASLVPAVGVLGARGFGRPAGTVAASVVAFYPELVWFSAHFWSETLFMVFLWWSFERLVAADSGGTGDALAAGLLWGLAILTRETPLYFTPVAALWLAWGDGGRKRVLHAGTFLLAATLLVVPWTARNWAVYGAFVPVSTSGALNLWQGNARLTRQEVYDAYAAVHGRIEKYEYARRKGIEAIRERQPAWIVEKLQGEMPLFWEADSLPLVHIKRGAYGDVPPGIGSLVAVIVLAPYLIALGLFVLGVASSPFERSRGLLLLFLAYYNAIHVATHGFARYRLPAMPVVFLFAAWAVASWRSPDSRRLDVKRKLVAVALAMVLAASVAPSLTSDWAEPSFRASEAPGTE
ncbi:MAG: glycosyltransferase family 39 protein [Vicinamibacteria bacterium]